MRFLILSAVGCPIQGLKCSEWPKIHYIKFAVLNNGTSASHCLPHVDSLLCQAFRSVNVQVHGRKVEGQPGPHHVRVNLNHAITPAHVAVGDLGTVRLVGLQAQRFSFRRVACEICIDVALVR